MASAQLEGVIRHLREVARRGEAAQVGDGELLDRFIARRDEAAFEALVHRHGSMVLGVCKRILRNEADAEDVLLKNKQFDQLRTRLLKEAAGFFTDLEKRLEGQTDAKSRQLLAEGYFQLGELTEKIGDKKQALAVQRKALVVRRELAAAGAAVDTRLDVARSLWAVGRLLDVTGDTAGALAAFQKQRDLATALAAEAPTDAVQAVLAQSHDAIGWVLSQTGQPQAALASYEQALAIRQKLADANPAVTQFHSDLGYSRNNIGNLLSHTGQPQAALASYETAGRSSMSCRSRTSTRSAAARTSTRCWPNSRPARRPPPGRLS